MLWYMQRKDMAIVDDYVFRRGTLGTGKKKISKLSYSEEYV